MNIAKYYFIHDNGVQWFSYIIEVQSEPDEKGRYTNKQITKMTPVPSPMRGKFLDNILSRETHFGNRIIDGVGYYGWSLSKDEYERLLTTVGLYPSYQEYLELLN